MNKLENNVSNKLLEIAKLLIYDWNSKRSFR